MHLYTVLWVVVATVFCMLSQKRQLPRRYAIAGHEPVEVYPESFGRIEVKPISNWRGWGGLPNTHAAVSCALVIPSSDCLPSFEKSESITEVFYVDPDGGKVDHAICITSVVARYCHAR